MILIGESKVKGTQPLLSRYSYWNLREKESSVAQLCLTLCDLMDCSPPGSSVHGISQTRILEWVAVSFSGNLPNLGIEPVLLHCRQILYCLSHQGSPSYVDMYA